MAATTDDPGAAEFLDRMRGHLPKNFARVMRRLPADPRCRLCSAPFGGIGGQIMRHAGFGPSRKNPQLCNTCFEKAPMGGVETEAMVLFADVRGFTALAEQHSPEQMSVLLNRLYAAAVKVLGRHAIIDKLIGDEVMALYLHGVLEDRWGHDTVVDGLDLLAAAGYGSDAGPWIELGLGVDVGTAYVGNVGSGAVKDFTAVGDVVNTAARLESAAGSGQLVMSDRAFGLVADEFTDAVEEQLELKGKQAPERAWIINAV